MTATSALLAGREAAERNMLDTCTVRAVTGVTTNPTTGVDTPTYGAALYPNANYPVGWVQIQTYEAQERNPEVGGATLTVQRYAAKFPVGAFVPAIGQVVMITVAALDPNLTGRTFRVVALLHKTAATAYRLGVEES